jgi:hypothetical protein
LEKNKIIMSDEESCEYTQSESFTHPNGWEIKREKKVKYKRRTAPAGPNTENNENNESATASNPLTKSARPSTSRSTRPSTRSKGRKKK